MDQEIVLAQFDRLEKKIEHLFETCKQLEVTNRDLTEKNQALEQQIQEFIMAEKQHNDIKNIIRSKIDGLMGRLDDFTESQEGN